MHELRSSILAALALYDGFGIPLTLVQIYERLVNPARFSAERVHALEWTMGDVAGELDSLMSQRKVECVHGFYALAGGGATGATALEREKISAQKWKLLIHAARWFSCVPFLRAVFVSGSLALSNASSESDFDVVVVVRHGRLYTGRVLLSLVASLMGMRRTKHERVAPDKFCFNHYLTDDGLAITHKSIYAAAVYNDLVPIIAEGDVVERFYAANPWILQYFIRVPVDRAYVRRSPSRGALLVGLRRVGEWILSGYAGAWVERVLRYWQRRRITTDSPQSTSGGRVAIDDTHMEFHPDSAEGEVIARYNSSTERLGAFWNYREEDSGLS